MGRFRRLSDRDVDNLLAGKVPSGHDELEDLAVFLRDAGHVVSELPAEQTEARHLAAIVGTAHFSAYDATLAAPPATSGEAMLRKRIKGQA